MIVIGCDYHPSWQQISFLDTLTGETGEKSWSMHQVKRKSFIADCLGLLL